jgi:hypothetical protein
MANTPNPALLDQLAASGAVWRGTSGSGLRVEASGIAALDARLPGGGWPAGALSELLIPAHGIGEVSLALPAVARLTQAGRHAAFVAPPHIPYAPALAQAGVVLERTLIVEPKTADETVWTIEQLLRTSAYGAVLAWAAGLGDADQRRLQLAAETGNALAFLYRPQRAAASSSVAALRLKLARENRRLDIEILKARGGRPGARFYTEESDEGLHPSHQQGGVGSRRAASKTPFALSLSKGER